MNNSKLIVENATLQEDPPADKALLGEMQSKRTKIIQAIDRVKANEDWKLLERELFEGTVEKLGKLLDAEMKKRPIDEPQIYFLQGQLKWAEKHANLDILKEIFKVEVENIKKQLK